MEELVTGTVRTIINLIDNPPHNVSCDPDTYKLLWEYYSLDMFMIVTAYGTIRENRGNAPSYHIKQILCKLSK